MKTIPRLVSALLMLGLLVGCDQSVKSGRRFVFPEGNSAWGHKAFVDMGCTQCHKVEGVTDLPAPTASPEKVVILGGRVARLRTYGDLVTSIIHPNQSLSGKLPERASYKDGRESPMKAVNDTMTVTQLLDIVTFLQPHYKELQPIYDGSYLP
jgi:sulfur-oxidizing protein SoxX